MDQFEELINHFKNKGFPDGLTVKINNEHIGGNRNNNNLNMEPSVSVYPTKFFEKE